MWNYASEIISLWEIILEHSLITIISLFDISCYIFNWGNLDKNYLYVFWGKNIRFFGISKCKLKESNRLFVEYKWWHGKENQISLVDEDSNHDLLGTGM